MWKGSLTEGEDDVLSRGDGKICADAGPDKSKKNQAEPGRAGETPEAAGAWTEEESQSICDCIRDMTGIPDRRVTIVPVREIPRSSSGKIRYADLH